MKISIKKMAAISVAAALLPSTMALAEGKGLKVGQNDDLLTQTRISNSGGGAAGNPHWGSAPHQDPWSGEGRIAEGENFGEAFQDGEGSQYNGYATHGENADWDVDPGNSGKNEKGGNASNAPD
jgi:hypothetical protein